MWEVGYSTGIRALPDSGAQLRQELALDEYPYLVEHMGQHVKASDRKDNGGGEFEFGLGLILDGLEKFRVTPVRPEPAPATAPRPRSRTAASKA
jgi:hypothetical protein